jgi:hypothetical protein
MTELENDLEKMADEYAKDFATKHIPQHVFDPITRARVKFWIAAAHWDGLRANILEQLVEEK